MEQIGIAKRAKDLVIDTPLVKHDTEAVQLVAGAQSRDPKSKRAPIFGLSTTVATGVDCSKLAREGDNGGLGAKIGHSTEKEVIKNSEE